MQAVQTASIYTADPRDIWTHKASFQSTDPFAIVLVINVPNDLVESGLHFDLIFQMVEPRQDPFQTGWYTVLSDGTGIAMPTKDLYYPDVALRWASFAASISWKAYADAVREIRGPERLKGLFFVRGTVDIVGTDLFAHSNEFWYKVMP